MKKKNLGKLGEDLALKHLKNHGYKILARNFRSKFGEVDIIVQEGETLVFVEVKTRWSKSFGPPEEAITPFKIRRMVKAGQYYKLLHPELPDSLRLDAVVIDLNPKGKLERVEIIQNLTGF